MNDIQRHELLLEDPKRTHELGRAIGESCRGGEHICLRGDLGAGKTTLVRGLAEGIGIAPSAISSPTYTILHEHRDGRSGLSLVHADLYRIGDADELESLGWEELRSDASTILAVEWPERVPEALPAPGMVLTLQHGPEENTRHLLIEVSVTSPHLLSAAVGRPCRSCGDLIALENTFAPFCSERCRMADLGSWFEGRFSISREIEEDDLIDPEIG
jgi:tRNA threonylcarbamoyladenosine biosynthesis protein TsaE